MSYKPLVETLLNCWEYRCGEDCPWYDYSPDEGFHCRRYKSFTQVEKFFEEALWALGEK